MRLKKLDSCVQVESIERNRQTGRLQYARIGSYDGDGNLNAMSRWELCEYDGHPNWLIWYRRDEAEGEVRARPCVRDCDLRLVLDLLDKLAEGEALGEPS